MTIDLLDRDGALALIHDRAQDSGRAPLAVVSANLDHVHHFGRKGRWAGTIGGSDDLGGEDAVEWVTLIDGAPIAQQARRLTGRDWPRLAGSDLVGPLLDAAERDGLSVAFIGGSQETHAQLAAQFRAERPGLRVAGFWAPQRTELADPPASRAIAAEIRSAGADILVVGIGKPRQELWIAEYGALTGARVLLAFGAVVDFLAGRVQRAPGWIAKIGMEWAWRLMLEPRRLARRYLGQGPAAYREVRSWVDEETATTTALSPSDGTGRLAVAIVTDGESDADGLADALRDREGIAPERVRVIDGTHGFAAAVGHAVASAGDAEQLLVIRHDLRLDREAVAALNRRMRASGAGIVVPRVETAEGRTAQSLLRDPTPWRALGDAMLGERFPNRPRSLSGVDRDAESYAFAHPVEAADEAALLIHVPTANAAGRWDGTFRGIREQGATVWYEPAATARPV